MDLKFFNDISETMNIKSLDFKLPEPYLPKFDFPEIPVINPEDTIMGDIKREIKEQNELASQQIGILSEQNRLLADNYNKLKEVYDAQSEAYKSAQNDLNDSRKYNNIMMLIAAIAMLAAIAGPIVTILVSK